MLQRIMNKDQYMSIYIYIYMYVCMYVCIYIYIYMTVGHSIPPFLTFTSENGFDSDIDLLGRLCSV